MLESAVAPDFGAPHHDCISTLIVFSTILVLYSFPFIEAASDAAAMAVFRVLPATCHLRGGDERIGLCSSSYQSGSIDGIYPFDE